MSYSSSLLIPETPPHGGQETPLSTSEARLPAQRRFKSARLTGEYEKPWLESWTLLKNGNKRKISFRCWDSIIFWGSIVIGIAAGGIMCYRGYVSVSNFEYCPVFEDNFQTLNSEIWSHEIQRGGFGTGSFDWCTDDKRNSYVDAEGLHIVPTLTLNDTEITPAQLYDGYTLNLTTAGTCTSKDGKDPCSIYSNKTSGAIINPVRSARLTTRGKASIKYGKVEVVAKMPIGDWLWPAIWMMPENDVYGMWPASGEIDIAESKGNNPETYHDGRDSVVSALHWGPLPIVDGFWKTLGKHNIRRTDYSKQYNTFGMEWSEKYLFTYINSRLLQVLFITWAKNHKNMWERGGFGEKIVNNSALHDPWSQTGDPSTPFDQPFYLILNVAVGSTNGYFPDQVGNKPWGDLSPTAQKEFWNATQQWYPTWGEGSTKGLNVKSVKMWKQGAC